MKIINETKNIQILSINNGYGVHYLKKKFDHFTINLKELSNFARKVKLKKILGGEYFEFAKLYLKEIDFPYVEERLEKEFVLKYYEHNEKKDLIFYDVINIYDNDIFKNIGSEASFSAFLCKLLKVLYEINFLEDLNIIYIKQSCIINDSIANLLEYLNKLVDNNLDSVESIPEYSDVGCNLKHLDSNDFLKDNSKNIKDSLSMNSSDDKATYYSKSDCIIKNTDINYQNLCQFESQTDQNNIYEKDESESVLGNCGSVCDD